MFEFLFKYPRDFYARSELVWLGDWPLWLTAGLAVAGTLAILVFLIRRRREATVLRLLSIGALQLAMLAAAIALLLQPTLVTERLRDGENSIALMLDTSGSMAYGPEETRRLDDALASVSAAMSHEVMNELSVRRYRFAGASEAVDSFGELDPDGERTSIAASVKAVLHEARLGPLAAIVLYSDGGDNAAPTEDDPVAELAGFGVPVHTIAVGRETMPEDLELSSVLVADAALPGSTISARVSIRHDVGGLTRVKVYDGDDLLVSQPVELDPEVDTTTAWVDVEMREAGHRLLSFTLDPLEGEQELRNNSRTRLVAVADQSYRILYFEGEPRWEYKFLRRALDQDPDLNLVTLLRVSQNKFYRQGLDSPQQLEQGFPVDRDELFGYQALIIGSVEAASLSPDQHQMIREFVSERGGSLLMLAGPHGLGNGGWGQSGIADVLPSRLPSSSSDSFYRRRVPVSLTSQGSASQMLRFTTAVESNAEAWLELPAVADYQLTGQLKPAATALLAVETINGALPLLVGQPFGRGHAYILATGGTWRWQMGLPHDDTRHQTFWRQLLRALVATAPPNVSLRASDRNRAAGISLRAEFRDEAYRPMDDVGVAAVISGESGDSWTVDLRPAAGEQGVYRAVFDARDSGTYYVEAVAERNGEPVGTIRAGIHHEAGQAEHFNIRRNTAYLQRLAEATGGQFLTPDRIDALPDLLRYSSSGVTELEYRPVWNAPAAFLLLLLLKAAEWLLRRRWGSI